MVITDFLKIATKKIKKKMTAENFISQEDFKVLKEENIIHEQEFHEFHKKFFNKMLYQAVSMSYEILKKDGKRPAVEDFENELNGLI